MIINNSALIICVIFHLTRWCEGITYRYKTSEVLGSAVQTSFFISSPKNKYLVRSKDSPAQFLVPVQVQHDQPYKQT